MLPVRLEWQRPRDGVECQPARFIEPDGVELDGAIFRPRSPEVSPISYHVANLENPIALHFINCRDNLAFAHFLERFGMLQSERSGAGGMWEKSTELVSFRSTLQTLFRWSSLGPDAVLPRANAVASYSSFKPKLERTSGGGLRLVIQASGLEDLMVMEAMMAIEIGAVITSCAHCSRAYLTGPLTGRRSHSVYCSDRCRVAAMRKRNAEGAKA